MCICKFLLLNQSLVNSAIMGIVIGICSAWVILVLTTFNFIIGTLATITIGLVTACVVGMIPLLGWTLGVRFQQSGIMNAVFISVLFISVQQTGLSYCVSKLKGVMRKLMKFVSNASLTQAFDNGFSLNSGLT